MACKVKIHGFDYNPAVQGGWVESDIDCELNGDESLAGASLPITPTMFIHMTEKYRNFIRDKFKDDAGNQSVHFTFGKEALLFLLSQDECKGITFCLGMNDRPEAGNSKQQHVTLIACASKERTLNGKVERDAKGRVIIEPIKNDMFKKATNGTLGPNDVPPPSYEVVPWTTLQQIEDQAKLERSAKPGLLNFL